MIHIDRPYTQNLQIFNVKSGGIGGKFCALNLKRKYRSLLNRPADIEYVETHTQTDIHYESKYWLKVIKSFVLF